MSQKDPKYYYLTRQQPPTKEEAKRWLRRNFIVAWRKREKDKADQHVLLMRIGQYYYEVKLDEIDFFVMCSINDWQPSKWPESIKRPGNWEMETKLPYKAVKTPRNIDPRFASSPNSYIVDVLCDWTEKEDWPDKEDYVPALKPAHKLFRDDEFVYIRTRPEFDNIFVYVPKTIPAPIMANKTTARSGKEIE